MINIKIPSDNLPERQYVLDIIFCEFLGLQIDVSSDENYKNWEILLDNGAKLVFEDAFFTKFKDDLSYLDIKNIPQEVNFARNEFMLESDIAVIFGNDRLEITNSQITCGLDIFASSFFMLTRWEEYVNKTRDKHDRFPATASLAYKFQFLDRPVVNEYLQMLKNMLLELDRNLVFKERKYRLFLTHDVDELYFWKGLRHLFRICVADIIKRKNILLFLENIAEYYLIHRNVMLDPFDKFEWLMDKSESAGVQSRFYFMSGGNHKSYDNRYDILEKKAINLINKIKSRNHIIGFHPSYNSYQNLEMFLQEKALLESVSNQTIMEGRQHYLRFSVPTTWQIWEDANMEIDSTCDYADREGFRCGTGDEFSVFNILTRKKLKLKERPLVYMDDNAPLGHALNNTDKLIDIVLNLQKKTEKYGSTFTILFHQNVFERNILNYKEAYEKIIG